MVKYKFRYDDQGVMWTTLPHLLHNVMVINANWARVIFAGALVLVHLQRQAQQNRELSL